MARARAPGLAGQVRGITGAGRRAFSSVPRSLIALVALLLGMALLLLLERSYG